MQWLQFGSNRAYLNISVKIGKELVTINFSDNGVGIPEDKINELEKQLSETLNEKKSLEVELSKNVTAIEIAKQRIKQKRQKH